MLQNGKLMPNLDQQNTKALNLTVLQRLDPYVEEILVTAAHVTFYEFNIDLNQWSRKNIEGSLFVVKRNSQPRFQFIVMNRRNTENLVEDILGDFEYEIQPPYLLYRNATQEVNGIWFYNQQDCEAVADLFSRILNAFSKIPPKPKLSSTKSEFEELEAAQNLAILEGPFEPTSSSTARDDPFVNFFSAAVNISNASNPTSTRPPHQTSAVPSASQSNTSFPPTITQFQPSPLIPNESTTSTNNLITPLLFTPPLSSSSSLSLPPSAPPLHPSSHGTPLLQPFPPPTPSPSLTPGPNYDPLIRRDKVRDALLRLVQNEQFIELVYRELTSTHNP